MACILVVDDDPGIREVLSEALTFHGHEVVVATDGAQGLRVAASTPPDLVITDIVMPEKEGLETIMELRRTWPELKIIAISGGGVAGPQGYLLPAEKLGADRSLAKPFRIDELLRVVDELLQAP